MYSDEPETSIVTSGSHGPAIVLVVLELLVARLGGVALPSSSADRGSGDRQCIEHGGDVVRAEDARAALERQHVRRDRARQPLGLRAAAGQLAEEALARGPDDDRPADRHELVESPQQLEVVLDGLAEADPGVEPDALLCDPRRDGVREPLLEKALTSDTTSS